ncbi:MAG: hypothetical protein ACOYOD_09845 [Saprospiraceae bacterium]
MSRKANPNKNIVEALDRDFTKEALQKSLLPLIKPVLQKYGKELQQQGYISPDYLKSGEPPAKTKSDILDAIAILFSGPEPYRYFRESLHKDLLVLWDALMFNEAIGFSQAKDEFGLTVFNPPGKGYSYYLEPKIKPPFDHLPYYKSGFGSYFYEHRNYYFRLPLALREVLVQYYEVPAEAKLTPVDTLPEGGIPYADAETQFLLDYYRLRIYYQQGEIAYTAKNRPSTTGLAKVQRMLKNREFFPNAGIRRYKLLRTQILASVIPYLSLLEKTHPEPQNLLREFFQTSYGKVFHSPPALLPDLRGMGYLEYYDFKYYEGQMLRLLRELPADRYVPVQNILGYCAYQLFQMDGLGRRVTFNRLSMEDANDTNFGQQIGFDEYKKAIELPLIRGSFFLFAALGLCELVYEEVKPPDFGVKAFSAWDGLIAVKRTPLGDYVCGLSKQYQTTAPQVAGFTLSDSALLIKLESADSPYASALGNFAVQVDPLSFKTDPRIFLDNVRTKEELTAKVELFKQMASHGLPKNWEDFFKGLHAKINPLTPCSDLLVFSLPQDNQELIRLIAQDPVIKPLVSKAEGYMILVTQKNYAALRRRLAEFGYLITG